MHNKYLNILGKLPEQTHRNFEVALTSLVEREDNNELRKNLSEILESDAEEKLRYAAFYGLSILYRRKKDISLLEKLVLHHESEFRDNATWPHLIVLYLKEKGIGRDVIRVIQKSYEAYLNIRHNAGIVHNFAETVISAIEDSDSKTQDTIKENWIEKAVEAIHDAIELDPNYAKYYCTKGRILAFTGDYIAARENIKRAIDIEDSSKSDYVVRLGNYQYYLLLVQSNQQKAELNNNLISNKKLIEQSKTEIDQKFKEVNIKNLEFLGFFAAIVSFTIGSIQIVNKQTFDQASSLIIVLFGALIAVFGGFGFVLHGWNKKSVPSLIVFVLGALIVLLTKIFTS